MHVYQSKEFINLADDQRVARDVTRLLKKLEPIEVSDDTRVPFFNERRGPYRIGHMGERNRPVIGELVAVKGQKVFCLHTLFFDHGPEYDKFNAQVREYRSSGNQIHPPYEINTAELSQWLEAQEPQVEIERVALPMEYQPWLMRPFWENHWVIYEGKEWVSRFSRKEFSGRWETMHALVEAAMRWAEAGGDTTIEDVEFTSTSISNITVASKSDRWIVFGTISVPLPVGQHKQAGEPQISAHKRQVLFLMAPFDISPTIIQIDQLITQHYEFFLTSPEALRFNEVAQAASRVYPWYIPLEMELWKEIESEEGVHLALSAEEENILLNLSGVGDDSYRLPIFINGRAGSGKTTILFYLFTEYLARYWESKNPSSKYAGLKGSPLFLTYNQELLSVARDRIQRMLKTRLIDEIKSDELRSMTEELMRPFRAFLRSLLPKDDDSLKRYLDDSKRITFHEFKRLFASELRSADAKRYSPDLCWYVIRTFIKGYTLNEYLDPDGYATLPAKEQTILPEDFANIYKLIWKWYEKYQDNHDVWDDQDLVRVVLDCGEIPEEEYAALFCDESQDFTRLELNLILHTSIFSRYELVDTTQIESLPFAFAGDPLQTLNPTGFRWSAVQAMFHDQIIQNLDRKRKLNIRMKHLDELDYNYRSTRPIVELTNAILLLRNHLFQQDTRPQLFWGKGRGSFKPRKFILEQVPIEKLRKSLKDTILLIPCDEGGEADFISNDKVLGQLFPKATVANPPKNVLSAVGAKGLEFRRVILYKFGESCPPKLWRGDLKPSEKIEAEYFFNKLYVASTRATHHLFLLDSQAGNETLWDHISEASLVKYIEELKGSNQWTVRPNTDTEPDSEYTARAPSDGLASDADDMVEPETEKDAKEFFNRGKSAENPEYLRRAASYYQELNRPEEVKECEAYAYKYEKNLSKAGQIFTELGKFDQALVCYWDGQLWQELLTLQGNISVDIIRLAKFMVAASCDTEALVNFTDYIADQLAKRLLQKSIVIQWQNGITEYCSRISSYKGEALPKETWARLSQVLEELHRYGYLTVQSTAAFCYYYSNDLKNAVRCWENSDHTQHTDYYLAQARTLGYPQSLEWWNKAGETDKVYQLWELNGGFEKTVDFRTFRLIAPILEQRKRYWDACQVYLRLPETDAKTIISVLKRINQFSSGMVSNLEEVKTLLGFLATRGQWDFLIQLLEALQKPIENELVRYELKQDLLRKLAISRSTDELLNAAVRERFYRTIIRPAIMAKDWHESLSMEKEVGPAIEKLGFDLSLRFYEDYINDDLKPGLRDYSRQRWMANADEKIQYFRERGDENRTLQLRSDFTKRKRDWSEILVLRPTEPAIRDDVVKKISPLSDLPRDTKVKEETGKWLFAVAEIEFVVYKAQRIATAQDSSINTVKFTIAPAEVKTSDLSIYQEDTPDGHIFSIPDWRMSGMFRQSNDLVSLEIAVEGLEKLFVISL